LYQIEKIKSHLCAALILLISFNAKAQLQAGFSSDINSGCLPLVVHFQDQSTGNPSQWTWNLGNGTISQLQNPTTTYFIPGTYHVTLTVKNSAGADSITKNQFITVRANPTPSFSFSDSTGCFPKTIQFSDNTDPGSGNITQWTWDFGDGNVSTLQNPAHTYSQPGNYSVTLKTINSFGCEKTLTRTNIVRLGATVADFSFVNTNPCGLPTNIAFSNTSIAATNYAWDFGDGSQSIVPNPTHSYSNAGTYNVSLIASNASNCRDTFFQTVIIGSAKADFIIPSPACVGAPLMFKNISSAIPSSANWIFSDGTFSASIDAIKTLSSPGTYHVTLISNFGACADTVKKDIVVHPKPTAAFIANGDLSKCSPVAVVNFTNTSVGAANYSWWFGDGSTSTTVSPAHSYLSQDSFDVKLVATNSFGCSDSITRVKLVKIKSPEIISLNGLPYRGCTPYTAHLSAIITSPEPIISWNWNFGDGNTSAATTPTHIYNAPGSYNVTLIINTAGGCKDTLTYNNAIEISNKPTANFSAAPLVTCASGQVQFTNLSTGGTEWLWDFGDDGFSNVKDPVHQFGDTGVFTIRLVTSSTGCNDTLTIRNYLRNDPPIGRMNIIQNCDNPLQVVFRDSSIGGQTYKWNFGDGDSSTLRYPVHTYPSAGDYIVHFLVTHGSCSYPVTDTIHIVDEHPSLSVSDTIFCKSELVTFTAGNVNASNISSYSWDFGDGATASANVNSNSYYYSTTGTFTPSVIVTDILGCTDTSKNSIPVKVHGPTAAFTNAAGTCVNSVFTFNDGSGTDGLHALVEWQWRFGDGSSQGYSSAPFTHVYGAPGSYNVSLRVKDAFGCYDSLLIPAAVIITKPIAAFSSADSIKCSNNDIQFLNSSSGLELQSAWLFGDGGSSNISEPSHSFATQSDFNVRLLVTDKFGCQDSTVKSQKVANPVAAYSLSDSFSTCPPLLVSISNGSSNVTRLKWDFGDGGMSSNTNPSHYYTTPGTYFVKLTVEGFGTCVDSSIKTIRIKGPTGTFHFDPALICTGGTINFTASGKGHNSFIWDFSDGNTNATTDSLVTHIYSNPGLYQPKLILIDTAGCQVPVVTPDTIKVLGVKARIGLSKNLFCDSVNLQFYDSSLVFHDLPASYSWSFGDGSASAQPNPVHTYNQPGNYKVRLIITSQAGCVDSASLSAPVTIVRSPQITFTNRPSLCLNDTISLHGLLLIPDTSAIKWSWDFGNGISSTLQSPSVSYTSAGNPQVTVTATNGSGCSNNAVASILVHPLPNVNAGTDTMICRGQIYSLQPTGAASYVWSADPTLSCIRCSNPGVNPVSKKVYFVTGSNEFGCIARDSVSVDVLQPFTIKVNSNDSLCAGEKIQSVANGAAKYNWFPAVGLSNSTISNPVANPGVTTNYMVIGSDAKNCFQDTQYVKLSVFPIPEFNIIDNVISLAAGSSATIKTNSSPDITHWKWYPAKDLSCADCPQPVVTARDNVTYRAEVWNEGGCASTDKVNIAVICNDGNVFIPNTFSPNQDGVNDVFYVRGKGINSVKSMKIFNRWGDLVFEKSECNANDENAGWNGTYKNGKLTPDVYVYIVDVVCSNNTVFTLKGNVTLIR
jgi:gliding motility-associated-like protein